jgi:hypothetical protein
LHPPVVVLGSGNRASISLMFIYVTLALAVTVFLFLPKPIQAQAPPSSPGAILRLRPEDSVELIRSGPLKMPNGQQGFYFVFHPFQSMEDSVESRAVADEIWRWLRPQLDSARSFVVLEATAQRASPSWGIRSPMRRFFVVRRRLDGMWYFDADAKPAK